LNVVDLFLLFQILLLLLLQVPLDLSLFLNALWKDKVRNVQRLMENISTVSLTQECK
jgi:hypothetical protein